MNCDRAEKADRQPAVGAGSAADAKSATATSTRRCSSRWRRAVRHSGADRCGPDVRPRRVLLPRLAGGLHRRGREPRLLAAGRSHVQSVSGRRHAFPARARRPRQAGRDPPADRPRQDHRCSTSRSLPARRRFSSDRRRTRRPLSPECAELRDNAAATSRWCLPCFLGGHE